MKLNNDQEVFFKWEGHCYDCGSMLKWFYIWYSNQHGNRKRWWCSRCGRAHDVELLYKNDEPTAIRRYYRSARWEYENPDVPNATLEMLPSLSWEFTE